MSLASNLEQYVQRLNQELEHLKHVNQKVKASQDILAEYRSAGHSQTQIDGENARLQTHLQAKQGEIARIKELVAAMETVKKDAAWNTLPSSTRDRVDTAIREAESKIRQ